MRHASDELLTDILKGVSRSFYLSLRILPRPLRAPMSLGYVLARSADTLADTEVVPREQRIQLLRDFQAALSGSVDVNSVVRGVRNSFTVSQNHPGEKAMLGRLEDSFRLYSETPDGDRVRLRFVLTGLVQGMIQDLEDFPGNSPSELRAFQALDDLDRYTYHAAGIVGEFWTEMSCAHLPSLSRWSLLEKKEEGIRFGKALQMVNVIKDAPRDLRNGRCYFPTVLLSMVGLKPADLLDPSRMPLFRPVVHHLIQLGLDHFEAASSYVLSIPRREIRLRMACIWPLWIGLRSLDMLARSSNLLDPSANLKIPRTEVYRLIRLSLTAVGSNALLARYTASFQDEVESALNPVNH